MNLWAFLSRLDRIQKGRRFKIVASVVVVALIASVGAVLAARFYAPSTADSTRAGFESVAQANETLRALRAEARGFTGGASSLFASGPGPIVALALGALCVVAVLIVWLGLSLTYVGLVLAAAVVAGPLALFEQTRPFALLTLGALTLTASFTAILRALQLALAPSHPVTAIARNTLSEAVRMRISLVFIVMLVFLISSLPMLLDDGQPLRYRVQLFLQYSTGGAYWVMAFLTVFFCIASVAFEQRDKVIWQTVTKPVSPWHYVLGKWIGVAVLNAALLIVSAIGIFLFTEHLRNQPAMGEIIPYVNADGSGRPSTDRKLLERHVLVARAGSPALDPVIIEAELDRLVDAELEQQRMRDGDVVVTPQYRRFERERIRREIIRQYRTLERGESEIFAFDGLGPAVRAGLPFSLRYRVNSASDNPSNLYRMLFVVPGLEPMLRETPLNTTQTFDIPDDFFSETLPFSERERLRPETLRQIVDENGRFGIQIWNGDPRSERTNLYAAHFETDGLEILYVVGGYETNYLRAMVILWAKLVFVAAIAIMAATFLSFPVACLVTLCVFFIAETSGYLREALEAYTSETTEGIDYVAVGARLIAVPISYAFAWYSDLKPTANLIDGRLVGIGHTLRAVALLLLGAAGSLVAACLIFARRELATYSGK